MILLCFAESPLVIVASPFTPANFDEMGKKLSAVELNRMAAEHSKKLGASHKKKSAPPQAQKGHLALRRGLRARGRL